MAKLFERYNVGNDLAINSEYGALWSAQTFTPIESHSVSSVRLKLYRIGSPGTVTASIRAVDGSNHPTGSDLASGTTDGDTLTTDTGGEWREITFSTPYALSAGTRYAIVFRAPSGNSSNNITNIHNVSEGYPGGNHERSSNSGSTWVTWATQENLFEEYGGQSGYLWIEGNYLRYIDASVVEHALALLHINVVTKTGDYTITTTDDVILADASSGAFTVTLPTAAGIKGRVYDTKKTDSSGNTVTLDGNGSETIDGATTQVIKAQYTTITVFSDGSNWHIR